MRPPLFLAIACGIAAACTEPPIELRLALPDPATVSEFDLSCVYAVKTRVIGNDRGDGRGTEVHEDCVDFDTAPQTFSELAARLRDQFRFDVPRGGLAGVQVSGFFGRCSDPTGTFESIVYGGAPNEGGGTLTVPLKPGVSCNMTQGYNVRVFDLAALYATLPGGGTCAAPPDPVKIFAGLIRPSMLGDHAPPTAFEYGHSSVDTSDGMARIQSYRPLTAAPACSAIAYRGTASVGLTCVRPSPQARGVCGIGDELEVISLPIAQAAASVDRATSATYGPVVFGSVWEASGNRVPIAGATVELADPSRGKVVYIDISAEPGASPPRLRQMVPVSGQATNASGGFLLYIPGEATDIVVRAPNHMSQTVRVASVGDTLPAVAVALARQ